jgi:hypothetical protein
MEERRADVGAGDDIDPESAADERAKGNAGHGSRASGVDRRVRGSSRMSKVRRGGTRGKTVGGEPRNSI